MSQAPRSVTIAFVFIIANALVWFGFALIVLTGMLPGLPGGEHVGLVMALLALIAAGALVALGILTRRRSKWGYVLTVAALIFLIALTVADQVGLVDLSVLVLVLVPLVLLIKDRDWYMRRELDSQRGD